MEVIKSGTRGQNQARRALPRFYRGGVQRNGHSRVVENPALALVDMRAGNKRAKKALRDKNALVLRKTTNRRGKSHAVHLRRVTRSRVTAGSVDGH